MILVEIVASDNRTKSVVNLSGSSKAIISDTERNLFRLSDYNLKKAVEAHFGQQPTDAFLRSPTPWDDLYQRYGWTQVSTTLTPVVARILRVSSKPSVIATKHFQNDSTRRATFNGKIKEEVQNTVISSWEKSSDFSVGLNINYNFGTKVTSSSAGASFSYTSKWGESNSISEAVTVGSESGVEITLEPGQGVVAELHATRGTMEIQVDYEATLCGSTAINYYYKYKDHHFWALDINEVMTAGGLRTSVQSREVIKFDYYSDSTVVIKNA
ncbi:spherulin-2A-like [Galleria mellonella]|uniref:Spherulin-2A-like n=1 Tax=Galleria mellonella TaxID=7137 RepID=A0A6J1WPN2_GALME|nr:spherulin-2A-like [Galleria mellonella]